MNKANVNYVLKNNLCIGCGICKAACPQEAIKIIFSSELGYFIPVINNKKCNGCGRCLFVCYGYGLDANLERRIFSKSSNSVLGNVIQCYHGYATDKNIRFNSASGGVVTALLSYAFKRKLINGAIVTTMDQGNPPKPKTFIAYEIDDLFISTGSKYCPTSFHEALNQIQTGKKYAVVGLPCHIYGIRKLAEIDKKIRDSISLFVGLICGGMPDFLGTLYILRKFGSEGRFIEKFKYRGGGWPGQLLIVAKLATNKWIKIQSPYPQYWHDTYGFFLPYRCTLCNDGFNLFSDVACGDLWLLQVERNHNLGISLIITRTFSGENLVLNALNDQAISITPIKIEDAIKSQRSLIHFKYLAINARVRLCRNFRREIPRVDFSKTFPMVKISDYLNGLFYYIGNLLAHKRKFWLLFDIFADINVALRDIRYGYYRILKRFK